MTGLLAPTLVQFEQEIDQELEKEQQQAKHGYDLQAGSLDEGAFQDCTPQQQITNNDLESLHEKVSSLPVARRPSTTDSSLCTGGQSFVPMYLSYSVLSGTLVRRQVPHW